MEGLAPPDGAGSIGVVHDGSDCGPSQHSALSTPAGSTDEIKRRMLVRLLAKEEEKL
jgi:hypothetical protein